jgi:chorismate dehydratase
MLANSDAALIIGDPALRLSAGTSGLRTFDLAELWRSYTGLGFIFAMWMTGHDNSPVNFAAARDEGLRHLDEIAANYLPQIGLSSEEMSAYLTQNISFTIDSTMQNGLEMYFSLAKKHGLCEQDRKLDYVT